MNFIIGKNGVGKTNLLAVIDLTRRLASGERLEDVVSRTAPFGKIDLFTVGSNSSSTSVSLQLKDKEGKIYELAYTISQSGTELSVSDEKLSILENSELKELYVRRGDSFDARTGDSGELTRIPLGVRKDELALANFDNSYASKIAAMIAAFRILWFDRSPDAYATKLHRSDSLDIANLDGLVVSLHQYKREQFDKAVNIIQQIIPEFKAPNVVALPPPSGTGQSSDNEGKAPERFIVYWGEKETKDLVYSLSGLSDGNFRVIQLIFALFDSEGSSCVIGEEIENGQHYGRIKTLMEVLKHLSVKLDVQVLFSTHSGEILTHISPSDVILCTKDEQGHSHYRNLEEVVDIPMVTEELKREPTTKELIDFGVV